MPTATPPPAVVVPVADPPSPIPAAQSSGMTNGAGH
jgi:hypothetical protein